MYAAFRECEARRNACCDKKQDVLRQERYGEAAIARNANVCSISRVRSTEKCVLRQEARRVAARTMWRSVDSPECECMQHFGSAEHGEMRVATRSTTCCDKPMWRSVDSPECECMQHFESAEHGEMRVATRSTTCCGKKRDVLRQEARRVATISWK